MKTSKIKYELAEHQGKDVIFIRFEYDKELNQWARKLIGVRWSSTQKAWYVLDTPSYRNQFGILEEPIGKEVLSQIDDINKPALMRYIETLQLKAYSQSTIRTYRNEFAQLLYVIKTKHINDLTAEELRRYFLYCVEKLELSENTMHSIMNAIKFYYEKVLKKEKMFFDIPRPKKKSILPNVLAISQVERLFAKLENLKHKTMLYLAYSAGLRVSEVVNMKIKDIHSERMVINIKGAKGKKDRTVILSESILELLRKYYATYKPKEWLFEGQYENGPYSSRSLQQIFHRAKNSSKILQPVTFHSLRHSYATHLHERGTDIKLIQELLGHNDIRTTLRYTHVSKLTIEKIISPFDQLNIKSE